MHQPPSATDPPTTPPVLASPTSNFKYLFSLSKPNNDMIFLLYSFSTSCVYSRHGKTVRLGRVNRVANQTGHMSKTGHFKRVKNGFRSIGLRVGSGWPVFFFFLRKQHVFTIWKVMQQIIWCKIHYFEFTTYIKN